MNRNELIAEYDNWYKRVPSKWTAPGRNDFMLQVLKRYPDPQSLIDIGCGNGHTLEVVQRRYPKCKLYGMDISQEALKLTQGKVKGAITEQAFVDQSTLELQFDWVLCMGVAEHFENMLPSLKKLKTITGKFCYMEIPNCLSYSPGDAVFRRLSIGSRQWEWHLTREMWEHNLYSAGFEIVEEIVGTGGVGEFVWVLK